MSATIFVAPAPVAKGEPPRVVRHPSLGLLSAKGGEWPDDFWTAARLRDGDVVERKRPDAEDEPKAPPARRKNKRSTRRPATRAPESAEPRPEKQPEPQSASEPEQPQPEPSRVSHES